jgi:hypothetical protein
MNTVAKAQEINSTNPKANEENVSYKLVEEFIRYGNHCVS